MMKIKLDKKVPQKTVKLLMFDKEICKKTGKTVYANKKLALGAMNCMKKLTQKELFVYKCQHCKHFHLTSSPPR